MCKRAAPCSLTRALSLAVSEWMLIFMLFIDALFSYLVRRFASYCELQVPCLICSRLDHVLSDEKKRFYWDFMCENHKLEISSLVLSHIRDKPNDENFRLLVGKMGSVPHADDYDPGTSGSCICSCCNERRGHTQNLFCNTSFRSEAAVLDVSSSLKFHHSRNNQMAIIDEALGSNRTSLVEKMLLDSLSHVESHKVKLSSDTESEVLFSNEDIAHSSALIRERDSPIDQSLQVDSNILATVDGFAFEKFIPLDTVPETSVLKLQDQEITNSHGCEELKEEHRPQVLSTAELMSFDEVSPSPKITETPDEASVHSLDAPGPSEMKSSITVSGVISKAESEPISTAETSLDMNSNVITNRLQMSNSLDLGDAYKLATKGRQLSGKLLEQRSFKDSARVVSEDLKVLLSQLSFSRGFELSLNDLSPNLKVSWNGEEIKSLDATSSSSSIGMQLLLQRRISLERNDSGLSLDGSISISDIDGESVVDRLKRQVEHDKKIISGLYKELEEERNASAVSAYQAMAMITRLQEEKAALHMEALQCLRMMEEQAEYDGDALQKAYDLVAQKEKELLDMETKRHLYNTNLQT